MNTLATYWCLVAHDAAMWPIHGHYACRVCGREYPVAWSNAKNEVRLKRAEPRVYEHAVVHGR